MVVEARRELLPVEYEEPIPTWPLGPLWWALKNPTQSWRIFLPDINGPTMARPIPCRRLSSAGVPKGDMNKGTDRSIDRDERDQ